MSRRERKKLRTRETIVAEARRLFAERGYDRTTITEIAEAADVAASTVFAYFATKDQIFFSDFDEMILDCARSVERWSDEGSTIDAIRRWFDERWPTFYDREPEWPPRRARIVMETPALEGLQRARTAAIEATFVRAFARDFDEEPDGVRSLVAANATLGAIAALTHYWQASGNGAAPVAVIEHALAFAAAGAHALDTRAA
jgi:AcrR family transcriptional regulator